MCRGRGALPLEVNVAHQEWVGWLLLLVFAGACTRPSEEPVPPESLRTFGEAVRFLQTHQEVLVLRRGGAQIAVVPAWQGRVLTSTNAGESGPSFGWINRKLISSGELQPHINAFGGEDRFWMGPEGGQFAIFFRPGDPFDFEHWQTPACLDTEPFETARAGDEEAVFQREVELMNYSGTQFRLRIRRTVRLLDEEQTRSALGKLEPDLRIVAFESENRLGNAGTVPWSKDTGLLSIWILGMFNPSPRTTVIVPFVEGTEAELGPIVNDSYFGRVPPERLRIRERFLLFTADGRYRSKIGFNPARARDRLGSWDAENEVLTVVRYNKPEGVADYVNSEWRLQEQPYRGDVVNSYNDGSPAPGVPPMGPFYELETSSPALELQPGEEVVHIHQTFHLTGSRVALNQVAERLLGVSLDYLDHP